MLSYFLKTAPILNYKENKPLPSIYEVPFYPQAILMNLPRNILTHYQ